MSAADAFAQALTDAGSRTGFEHDGFIYTQGVPAECVRAYAAGRSVKAGRQAILDGMASAYMGRPTVVVEAPGQFVAMCVVAWAARCAALERLARGIAA